MVLRRERTGHKKEPSCPRTVTAHANAGFRAGVRVQRVKGSSPNDSRLMYCHLSPFAENIG